jgi:hypothetical protein
MPSGRQPRFRPHLSILPRAQRRLWDELAGMPPSFVLYGGTAVALHLGHRRSLDFDFFSPDPFDPARLLATLPFLNDAALLQQAPNTLTVTLNRKTPVRVSFFRPPKLRRVTQPLQADNGIRIAALIDLAATKVEVIQRRAEAKDYIDIDAILASGQIDLATALAAACFVHGPRFQPMLSLKALSYFGEGNVREVPTTVRRRLEAAVHAVDPEHLPTLPARTTRKRAR